MKPKGKKMFNTQDLDLFLEKIKDKDFLYANVNVTDSKLNFKSTSITQKERSLYFLLKELEEFKNKNILFFELKFTFLNSNKSNSKFINQYFKLYSDIKEYHSMQLINILKNKIIFNYPELCI